MIHPLLIRYGIYPLHQLKTGRRVESWHQQFLRNQWRSSAELHSWQEQRLQKILNHAKQHVPYYREKLKGPWEEIPLLSKAMVRQEFDQLQALDKRRTFTTVRTSGSTGLPTTWRIDRQAEDVHNAIKWRGRGWWNFRVGNPQVWLWGRDEFLGARRSLRDLLVYNKHLLGLLDLSSETVVKFYQNLLRWKPSFLYGYPSGLVELVRLCEEKNYSLSSLKLKGVITTAEILTQSQRAYLRQAFDCPVINEYGCAEVQIIAFECPQGSMHINSDALRIEFLSGTRPVKAGEFGEIVVTDLFNETMPLIRYRTGDVGRPREGSCPCGRKLPLMELTVGREVAMIRLPDGRRLHPEVLTPPHENPLFRLVERFRIVQEAPDFLKVQVMTQPERFDAVCHHFTNLIHDQIGNDLKIEFERVAEIPRDPSGKLRYFVSSLNGENRCA